VSEKPLFGVFEHENKPYWSGPNYPEHFPEDEQPLTQYPVVVLLECCDFDDGDGWGREGVEAHATVLDEFLHDVGAGDSTYGVLVRVENAENLLWLLRNHELAQEELKPLYE